MRATLGLPRLHCASLLGDGNQHGRVRLGASPRLERLRLAVPYPVDVAMPALRSLDLCTSHGSTLECPALEELVFRGSGSACGLQNVLLHIAV